MGYKYVVICYSVHEKCIENYNVFDKESDAYDFLEDEWWKWVSNERTSNNGLVDYNVDDYGRGYVISESGNTCYTWEVIKVRVDDKKTYKTKK